MSDFTTVFLFIDNTSAINKIISREFGISIIGICFLVYILIGVWVKTSKKKSKAPTIALTIVLLLIGVPSSIISIKKNYETKNFYEQRYQELLRAYDSQQYQVAEGVVQVLHTEESSGHTKGDIINVGGTQFEFSFFELSYGYNQTITHNGVLQEGTYVKIYYFDGVILRIDVKNS